MILPASMTITGQDRAFVAMRRHPPGFDRARARSSNDHEIGFGLLSIAPVGLVEEQHLRGFTSASRQHQTASAGRRQLRARSPTCRSKPAASREEEDVGAGAHDRVDALPVVASAAPSIKLSRTVPLNTSASCPTKRTPRATGADGIGGCRARDQHLALAGAYSPHGPAERRLARGNPPMTPIRSPD